MRRLATFLGMAFVVALACTTTPDVEPLREAGDDVHAEAGPVGGMPDSCYMWRSGGALADGGIRRDRGGVGRG